MSTIVVHRDKPTQYGAVTRVKGHRAPVPKKMGRKENVLKAKSKRFNLIKTKLAEKNGNRNRDKGVLVDIGPSLHNSNDTVGALEAMDEFEDGASEEKEDCTLLGRHHELSSKIQELEMLAEDFRGKVGELTQQFEGLQEDIEELVLKCEGNQQNYWMALDALKEEKATVDRYAGFLANAEIENTLLRQCVPKEDQDAASAFSQARPGSY
ncbi:hypothetical protein FA13DRAFT_1803995 [Coprinellus micaceus]|uniref:Uncharacterized protein n=1 Tax=Coprinellus micaceus TaxID=71717 RepID=A0A4Y7S9U4_COPMI|nr:hypothetical protein FA13DRAFT_1803995 [Coprinellus micaceus]